MAITIRCPNCGYEGKGKITYKGSTAVGCVLLLFFVIPGLIYAVWQSSTRHASCPQCKWENVVVTEGSTGIDTGTGCVIIALVAGLLFFFMYLMA